MKKILFVHDLLSSSTDAFVQSFLDQMQEVQVVLPELPINPEEVLHTLRELCETEKPDLVVGWMSGAGVAQQLNDQERVLINPEYQLSVLLQQFLGPNDQVRVPYLFERSDGQTDFAVTPQLVEAWQEVECHQFDGVNRSRQPVHAFFWMDHNVENVRIHSAHYHDVCYLPGHHYLDNASLRCVGSLVESLL